MSNLPDLGDCDNSTEQGEPANHAPDWLINFRRSGYRKGSYVSGPGFGVVFTDRGSDVLMVSWDNLSSANEDTIDRTPWGYAFVAKNGWSQLGIMTFSPDWFRNDELIEHLIFLRDSGFFRRFGKVVMTGTSMGAYAATAFASLVPGCTVVAFSPQSTLRQNLVPWETRFASGRRADWSGLFADGAQECRFAGQVFIVYDPQFEPDARQVARYESNNITRLNARYSGHKTALFLRRAGLLSSVVKAAVAGTLTETEFYRIYRDGRALPWYRHAVLTRLIEGGHQRHVPRFAEAMQRMGADSLARSALARLSATAALAEPGTARVLAHRSAQAETRAKPMGPHQRRLAERAAAQKTDATALETVLPNSADDFYQADPAFAPLRQCDPLPWQQIAGGRRKNHWRQI